MVTAKWDILTFNTTGTDSCATFVLTYFYRNLLDAIKCRRKASDLFISVSLPFSLVIFLLSFRLHFGRFSVVSKMRRLSNTWRFALSLNFSLDFTILDFFQYILHFSFQFRIVLLVVARVVNFHVFTKMFPSFLRIGDWCSRGAGRLERRSRQVKQHKTHSKYFDFALLELCRRKFTISSLWHVPREFTAKNKITKREQQN